MASTTKQALTAPYQNLYHARRVAETAAKACYICYKPTTIVLVTPCQKDFFYTCQSHLNDRGFAIPQITQEELEKKKREEEIDREKQRVLKEYEEKKARKKEKEKEKDKDKKDGDKDKSKEKEKDKDKKDDADDSKDKDTADNKATEAKKELEYRIYTLHKDIYRMRLQRTIQISNQRKVQELLRDPGAFPEAPRGFG